MPVFEAAALLPLLVTTAGGSTADSVQPLSSTKYTFRLVVGREKVEKMREPENDKNKQRTQVLTHNFPDQIRNLE